jgi:YdcK Beta solenoid repeat
VTFIEKPQNVSGDARVFGDARVYGNARVSGDALVSGDARVFGNARVSGNARVAHAGDLLTVSLGDYIATAHKDAKVGIRLTVGCSSHGLEEWAQRGPEILAENQAEEYEEHLRLVIELAAQSVEWA